MKRYLLVISCCLLSILVGCKKQEADKSNTLSYSVDEQKERYVIMISIDGFRADYLERTEAKDLKIFAQQGIKADYMEPCYPSSTFANHTSLATGLYPENHGILDNRFYDRSLKEKFDAKKQYESKWFKGTPLWTLAQNNSVNPYCSYWFGAGASADGNVNPAFFLKYDRDANKNTATLTNRMNTIVAELKKPEDIRPHLLAVYISQVDDAGHNHGPDAINTNDAIQIANNAIKSLVDQIANDDELKKLDVNYIVVSDHGMVNANTTETIPFPTVDDSKFEMTTDETMIQIYAKANVSQTDIDATWDDLNTEWEKSGHKSNYSVVLKKDNKLYATGGTDTHGRIGDILLVANSPYQFYNPKKEDGKPNEKKPKKGCHGYDPKNTDMRATFFAWGPAFNTGTIEAFKNVEVYPLVAHLLGLKYTHTIDGTGELVNPTVLKTKKKN